MIITILLTLSALLIIWFLFYLLINIAAVSFVEGYRQGIKDAEMIAEGVFRMMKDD